jgi:hypothetical protein
MTSSQILKALNRYISAFQVSGIAPTRFNSSHHHPTTEEAMRHAYWMALETQNFADASPAKAERWLCFIQGVMWSFYGSTIDEFRADNKGED